MIQSIEKRCDICIRKCRLGKSFCGRRDKNGFLKQPDKFCVKNADNLHDKPLMHFRNNERILSVGTWGCNLRCRGCQNSELSCSVNGKGISAFEISPEKIISEALINECKGVCFTYNEPAIVPEAVEKIAALAKSANLFTVFVTNSTLTLETTDRISQYIDTVAADIKSMHDDFYYNFCGAGGIEDVAGKILLCIKRFRENGCHVEVRTNIIPGGNDRDSDFMSIASWINDTLGPGTPWHITRFFPAHELSHLQATPADTLYRARDIGVGAGLEYVHVFTDKGCDCARKSEVHSCCKNHSE